MLTSVRLFCLFHACSTLCNHIHMFNSIAYYALIFLLSRAKHPPYQRYGSYRTKYSRLWIYTAEVSCFVANSIIHELQYRSPACGSIQLILCSISITKSLSWKVLLVPVRCRTQNPVYVVCPDTRNGLGFSSLILTHSMCTFGAVQLCTRTYSIRPHPNEIQSLN